MYSKKETVKVLLYDLKPHPKNPKKHNDKLIEKSISELGYAENIVIDENNVILAGHGRVDALKKTGGVEAGGMEIDAVRITGWTEEEKEKYLLLSNQSTILGGFDNLLLKDFDGLILDYAGLNSDILIEPEEKDDHVPEVPNEPQSKLGDLYILGNHRVLCGDSTKLEDVERLMDGKKADMVFTDPPYGIDLDTDNTKISSGWTGVVKGATNKKYSKVINDDVVYDSSHIFRDFDYVKEIFLWGANYFADTLPNLTKSSWIVWDKTNDATIYTIGSEFELLWSRQKHRQEIIRTRWAGAMGTETQDIKKRAHPTQKPLECLTPIINKYSKDNSAVIDLFGGSGSTLIACEQLNRTCYMMELDPKYVDVIIKRWEDYTGKKAEKLV